MLADELPYLNKVERALLRTLDVGWSAARGALWIATVPWSMLLIGVKGPGAFSRGHRGPVRSALGRVFGRNDLGDGAHDRATLEAAADGAVASLRGTVRAIAALDDEPGAVWTRVDASVQTITSFTERWQLVYEEGVDFDLVLDDNATTVRVESTNAFFVAPPGALEQAPDDGWLAGTLPSRMPAAPPQLLSAHRRWLKDGARVRIVGVKSRFVDASVESRMARETPLRIAVAAGPSRPLLIVPD